MKRDGVNHHEKLGLRDFHVQVNLPSPIWQVGVPIWCVITSIQGVSNSIRQVLPLISHTDSYLPHHSHLHPPFLFFSSTTLPSLQNKKLSYPSQFLHTMIMSWHRVHHIPSKTYTNYSIHQIQHTPSTAYTDYSIYLVEHPPIIVCLLFILVITRSPLNVASAFGMPPYMIDPNQAARLESLKVISTCHIPMFVSQLTDD